MVNYLIIIMFEDNSYFVLVDHICYTVTIIMNIQIRIIMELSFFFKGPLYPHFKLNCLY